MADETETNEDKGTTKPETATLTLPIEAGSTSRSVTLTATLTPTGEAGENGAAKEAKTAKDGDEPPVVTRHEITIDGKTLAYTVTTGKLPIKNEKGETEAHLFFMAYTKNNAGDPAQRPLMFSFNGGPGSSSVWLHLGALSPYRVAMNDDGSLPPPPYRLVENPQTWLDETDLVFIDPVGTGYSRAVKPEEAKKFWSVQGDIEAMGEFIRLYLSRYERWRSPLFLVGESYGTTRAAGLAGHLIERGIAFNGILLVSSVLNFQTLIFDKGNDLPYILFLPTYTATAWYHNRLAPDLQGDLQATLREAKTWAETDYALALAKGDRLDGEARQAVISKLARLTGLSERYIDDSELRVDIHRFCKELLRDQRRTVGRLDSRLLGLDARALSEHPDHDPSMTAIRPPYTAALNDYVRTKLGWKTDEPYFILGGGIKSPWEWSERGGMGYPDTSESLRSAFAKNPHMRVFVASGYYDLATPYFATEYTLSHMGLDPSLNDRVTTAEYEAGHMMYIHIESLAKLKTDVSAFLALTLSQ